MADSGWGRLTWGQAPWDEDTALGTGWGAKGWGDSEWGDLSDHTITLTGLSATTTLGTLTTEVKPGWGTLDWGKMVGGLLSQPNIL